jgi:hypothetical protein
LRRTSLVAPFFINALLLAFGLVCQAESDSGGRPAKPVTFHRIEGNIVKNASFEENWFNRKFTMDRRFLLLHGSDMGVGEPDGHIDHWRFQGVPVPESWDTAVSRSGLRSVRFDRAGTGSQLIRFAGEQSAKAGGAFYAEYLPMVDNLANELTRRPIVLGAWCRAKDVPEGGEPELVVTVQSAMRKSAETTTPMNTSKATAKAAFSAGTHDWEYREVKLVPKKLRPPQVEDKDVNLTEEAGGDQPDEDDITVKATFPEFEGAPFWVTVQIVAQGGGTAWFDDVSCLEPPDPIQPNVLGNGGFEALDETGWPKGWSRPAHWGWFRNTYYAFTGWSHWKAAEPRGGAALDPLVAFHGRNSLRFNVLPGDDFAVGCEPLPLNQEIARPIEARAMVKADSLRTLEIMAQDQNGGWLQQGDFLGDDMEEPGHYNFGTTGSGTYDWSCVRKYFSPRAPVKSLRLFLCARGFDGAIVEKNVVGTVWFDRVQVFEHGKAGKPATATKPASEDEDKGQAFKVIDFWLGDRLWGRNTVRALLEFARPDAAELVPRANLLVSLLGPGEEEAKTSEGSARLLQPAVEGRSPGYALVACDYEVNTLCRSWQEQYRMTVELVWPGAEKSPAAQTFHFGTPSTMVQPGQNAYFLYPGEEIVVFANLNVSQDAFRDLSHCEVVFRGAGGASKTVRFDDFASILRPQRAPDYVNTRNLVQVRLQGEGFTVHPWQEPVLDNSAVFRLFAKSKADPALVAESQPVWFGFMERVPKPDFPDRITRTAVDERGFITVNGEPYFPVYWTPHFGIMPEVNYPPSQFGLKAVDLTSIVCPKEPMSDDEVKASLLKKIAEVKDDPKFFQYELGDGEMQLQQGWAQRLERCKRAIPWIREADPNHVINGPISWLIGHPGHNNAMKHFVPEWDVIGVEASFEHQPKVNEFAKPLMKERRTAVLVGLETYFYQSNQTLRWRGYRSLLNGATGIGLCPSGMMQSRPDKVNYLRGLNGEFRGLAKVLTAVEPKERVVPSSQAVETLERESDGKRYVIAVSNSGAGQDPAGFAFPKDESWPKVRVLFEARTIASGADGFKDDFSQPQTVHVYELSK